MDTVDPVAHQFGHAAEGRTDHRATGAARFGLYAAELDPMPLVAPFLPAGVEVRGVSARVEGSLADGVLELDTEGRTDRLVLALDELVGAEGEHEWTADWKIAYANEELTLERLEARAGTESEIRAAGRVPLAIGSETPFPPGSDLAARVLSECGGQAPDQCAPSDLPELQRHVPVARRSPRAVARAVREHGLASLQTQRVMLRALCPEEAP